MCPPTDTPDGCPLEVLDAGGEARLSPNPNPSPNPICPISPEAHIKSTLAQILRQHPTLPLAQILIWAEEAYNTWLNREMGPETWDPLEGLGDEAPRDPNQDTPMA